MADTEVEYCYISVKVSKILDKGQDVDEFKDPDSTKAFGRVDPSFPKWFDPFKDDAVWLAALESGYNVWMRVFDSSS